jgi:hypothetical protein
LYLMFFVILIKVMLHETIFNKMWNYAIQITL